MHAMSSAVRPSAFDHRSESSTCITDAASPGNNPLGNGPFGGCVHSSCLPIHAQRLPLYGRTLISKSPISWKKSGKRERKQEQSTIPNEFNRKLKRSNFARKYQQQEIPLSRKKKSPRHLNPNGEQQQAVAAEVAKIIGTRSRRKIADRQQPEMNP